MRPLGLVDIDIAAISTALSQRISMNRQNISRENYQQTYVWFRQAAERGDPYAQFNLGLMYK
jgi:TPR repeat protein